MSFWQSFQLNRDVMRLEGKVDISAAAAVVDADSMLGGSWAKQGTGIYRFTVENKHKREVFCAQVSFKSDTDVDLVAQIDTDDLESNGYIDVKLLAGATATDPSAACSIYLYLSTKR